jgi:hypothetical protein
MFAVDAKIFVVVTALSTYRFDKCAAPVIFAALMLLRPEAFP